MFLKVLKNDHLQFKIFQWFLKLSQFEDGISEVQNAGDFDVENDSKNCFLSNLKICWDE